LAGQFVNIRDSKSNQIIQRVDVLFGIWTLWGVLLMALAHTNIIVQSWFHSFRFWVGQIAPTVSHPPATEVIDPIIASSFLAMLWATSPLAWFGFRRLPPEKLFKPKAWIGGPRSGRAVLAIVVMAILGIAAFSYDFQSRRMGGWLVSNLPGFTLIASAMAAFPWFCVASVRAWWRQFDKATADLER
jgi:hypothetical protein